MAEVTIERGETTTTSLPLCPVQPAARIIGQKWTLQIVYFLLGRKSVRFCELQDELGGVNPSTLSSRLKMLEEEGLVHRTQISAIPPMLNTALTAMGCELEPVIRAVLRWSNVWLGDRCGQVDYICLRQLQ